MSNQHVDAAYAILGGIDKCGLDGDCENTNCVLIHSSKNDKCRWLDKWGNCVSVNCNGSDDTHTMPIVDRKPACRHEKCNRINSPEKCKFWHAPKVNVPIRSENSVSVVVPITSGKNSVPIKSGKTWNAKKQQIPVETKVSSDSVSEKPIFEGMAERLTDIMNNSAKLKSSNESLQKELAATTALLDAARAEIARQEEIIKRFGEQCAAFEMLMNS